MKTYTFVLIGFFLSIANSAENSANVNINSVSNSISDKFISYQVDFYDLMDFIKLHNSFKNLDYVAPAYIKLSRFSKYLKDSKTSNGKFDENDVKKLFDILSSHKMVPVVIIDYDKKFEAVQLINDLKIAKNLNIKEIIWQLGDGSTLDTIDPLTYRTYSEDLKTLKILCESLKKESQINWDVVAVASMLGQTKLPYTIAGYDMKALTRTQIVSTTDSIDGSIGPAWVNIIRSNEIKSPLMSTPSQDIMENLPKGLGSCDHTCLSDGLLHAQILGNSAQAGYDVLFFEKSVKNSIFTMPNNGTNLKQAINILHKNLISSKVFNVKVSKSSQMSFYAFCSSKMNGAMTLMGINYSNMRAKFNLKNQNPFANAMIQQYLLTVSDGNVLLNNEPFNPSSISPSYKFKKSIKSSAVLFTLPPFSMGYWTIKNANHSECMEISDAVIESSTPSADYLLLKLVAAALNDDLKGRKKRQISDFLPKFELDIPFKFPNLMTSASNHKPITDFLGINTEVYKVAPIENPLQSSENPSLPKGDVYLLVNDGSPDYVDPNAPEHIYDHDQQKRYGLKRKRPARVQEITEKPDYFIPSDYIVEASRMSPKSSRKSSKNQQPKEIGELFEVERPSSVNGRYLMDQSKSASQNVELKTITRELEPTYRQSKSAILAAKRKWDKDQLVELLKDAQLEEVVDRDQFKDTGDYEIIDLTENYDEQEEYDDDDGFFDGEEDARRVRTRRDITSKNEIPKYGPHLVDENSLESLEDDIRMFLPRNSEETFSTPEPQTTQKSTALKAIDFFSKSLNAVVDVMHGTIIGWWEVFTPSDRYY